MVRIWTILAIVLVLSLPQTQVGMAAENDHRIVLIDNDYFMYTKSPQMQNAIATFVDRNPDYSVEIREYAGDLWDDQILIELMSSSTDVDILPMYDRMYYAFLDHGILSDLFLYPGFEKNVSDWIDISGILGKDGSLYCVPIGFLGYTYKWNEHLANFVGIEAPDMDWSWSEFEKVADCVKQKQTDLGRHDVFLIADSKMTSPTFFWQYACAYQNEFMSGKKKFNDPEFIYLLKLWKSLIDDGLVYTYETLDDVDFSKVLIQDGMWVENETQGTHVQFPRIGQKSYPVTTIGLGVYARSAHNDKAAELLQIFSSKENIVNGLPYDGIYLKDISYWHFNASHELHSEEYTQYLRKLLEGGTRDYVNESLRRAIANLWPRYLVGDIMEDQMAASLDEAYQMSVDG